MNNNNNNNNNNKICFINNSFIIKDTRFFATVCQSLGIPFIIENTKLHKKTCGFRDKVYQKKMKQIKGLYEKQIVIYIKFIFK